MPLGTVGKYELLEKLSEGGMGELYRARTRGPGGFERIVAFKSIRPDVVRDPSFVQMFVEEAKVSSLLSHQNLVHLYDFGSEGGVHYLALEMVEGRDLARVLVRCREERAPLSIRIAVRTAREVAAGLDYLHRLSHKGEPLQLIHRDVSPQNIMLSFDGAVKLTDFGIVRWNRRERTTRLGVVKGKAGYLAPEQVMDVPIDARTDLFSLGIVLWECLTGARLFPGKNELDFITQILQRPIRPPSSLNSEVSPALDAIVLRALSRDRDGRFNSAQEMAQALGALSDELGDETEVAQLMRHIYPDSAKERVLGLSSSVALVRAEVSEVRKFLGFPSNAPSEETKAERPGEATDTAPTLEAEHPKATELLTAAEPSDPSDDVPTAPRPRPERRPWLAGATIAAAIAVGMIGGRLWLRSQPSPAPDVEATPVAAPAPAPSIAATAAVDPPTQVIVPPAAPASTPTLVPTPKAADPATRAPAPAHPKVSVARKVKAVGPQGTLAAVQVHPWAEVVVDGRPRKWFSPGRWQLAAGHHEITLSNPNIAVERHFAIDLTPGGTVIFSGPLESLQPQSEE